MSFDLSKQEHKAEAYLKVGNCYLAPSAIGNTMLACCTCTRLLPVVVCLLDLTSRPCTFGSKQFRTVAQVNPYGKVPALQDGNLTLVRHSSCRLFGHVRLRNMCLALLRSWQLPQQHPYLNTCEGGSFLARAQTESGAMLQYLMGRYDKKVQTLEDRALVANWVFFAYTSLVSSLLPGLQPSGCTHA